MSTLYRMAHRPCMLQPPRLVAPLARCRNRPAHLPAAGLLEHSVTTKVNQSRPDVKRALPSGSADAAHPRTAFHSQRPATGAACTLYSTASIESSSFSSAATLAFRRIDMCDSSKPRTLRASSRACGSSWLAMVTEPSFGSLYMKRELPE